MQMISNERNAISPPKEAKLMLIEVTVDTQAGVATPLTGELA